MKRLVTRLLYGLAVLLLAPGLASAQDGTITGTVTDAESGEPLPGATVQIADLGIGAATDAEGVFSLDAPAGTHLVSVSFVGFDTAEREIDVPAGETVTANFALEVGAAQLGEVVVQGYGVTRRRVESGSIGSVQSEDIETVTARSADAAIQGRISGARITSSSGQPGAGLQFQIRGAGSITAGSDPLIIVDGVQFSEQSQLGLADGNPLNGINPADIESIEVLKDASAKSIYGAQAANGVVLITTKQGREGPTEVSFSTQLGSVDRINEFDVLNSEQYLNGRIEAYENFYVDRLGDTEAARQAGREAGIAAFQDPNNPDLINTNWQDAVFRSGITQTYNLSLRGGNEETTFFISGRFARDEGQIIESLFRQGGLRANLDHEVNDRVTVESKVNLTTTNIRGTIGNGPFITSPYWAAQFIQPTLSLYNEPGNPESGYNLLEDATVFDVNPVAQEDFDTRSSNANQIVANAAANVEILPSLFSRTVVGVQHEDTNEEEYSDPRLPSNQAVGGSLQVFADRRTSVNVSQSLTFDKLFADVHAFTGLLGAEYKQEKFGLTTVEGQGFPNFLYRTLQSAAEPTNVNSARSKYRTQSVFANGEYTYDDTYQLRGVVRVDGSSRFGEENRWGTFGAVSGFWRISNESFMDDIGLVDNLLIRGGYGVTGNSQIGNFASRQLFVGSGEYANRPGVRPSSLGNPQLTWEENEETNFGIDFAVLNRRLSGSVDVYRSDRQELLLGRSLPSDSGFGSITENVGEIRNEGVEIELSTLNLDLGGFQWATDFNIAFQRSEVLSLTEDQDELTSGGLVYRVGEPVGQLRYTRYAGANPANGRPMYYDENGELTYIPGSSDEQLVGNLQPDFFGGLTNRFSYGGLSVDVFFQYDYGRTTLNNNAFFSDVSQFNYNSATRVLDRWQEPGDVTDVPKFFIGNYQDGASEAVFSTRFVEDASYIRLKQVKVTYQFPDELVSRSGLKRASLFVQGENLATITDFTGPDPEVVGTALGEYPQSRRLTVGLNVTL